MSKEFMRILRADAARYRRVKNLSDVLKLYFSNSGYKSVVFIRFIVALQGRGRLIAKFARIRLLTRYGLDFSLGCKVGEGLRIEHPVGIVLGKGVCLGDNCIIGQSVTIGEKYQDQRSLGQYPQIGNNVVIGAGAIILGNICIGANSTIGASSLVLSDVPANSTIFGVWK